MTARFSLSVHPDICGTDLNRQRTESQSSTMQISMAFEEVGSRAILAWRLRLHPDAYPDILA